MTLGKKYSLKNLHFPFLKKKKEKYAYSLGYPKKIFFKKSIIIYYFFTKKD